MKYTTNQPSFYNPHLFPEVFHTATERNYGNSFHCAKNILKRSGLTTTNQRTVETFDEKLVAREIADHMSDVEISQWRRGAPLVMQVKIPDTCDVICNHTSQLDKGRSCVV